jgi:hypothetical protein
MRGRDSDDRRITTMPAPRTMESTPMEIRIGVQHAPREVALKSDEKIEDVRSALETAITEGTVAHLHDAKGNSVLVPGSKIAYVELTDEDTTRVGFFS